MNVAFALPPITTSRRVRQAQSTNRADVPMRTGRRRLPSASTRRTCFAWIGPAHRGPRLRRRPPAKAAEMLIRVSVRQPRLSVSALLCRYSLLAGHAERDTFALRLLTRCAFGSLESFRDFRGGLFAGRALQKPNVFLRPRSPCRSLLRSRRRLRHVWFSSVDPTYLPRSARFASSAAFSEPDHTSTLEDHQSDQVSQSDAPRRRTGFSFERKIPWGRADLRS
jgi:hypothetical protein